MLHVTCFGFGTLANSCKLVSVAIAEEYCGYIPHALQRWQRGSAGGERQTSLIHVGLQHALPL